MNAPIRVAFVTNFCPHYRVRTFEALSRVLDVTFLFYSGGDEWYWRPEHGIGRGNFKHAYLPGLDVLRTRVSPSLPWHLLSGRFDVLLSGITGRFALPISYLCARVLRKPFLLWTGIWHRVESPAHRIFFPLTRHIYRHANAVVVYGQHVKRYLVSEGVRSERVFVAPHAVDNTYYCRRVSDEEKSAWRQRLGLSASERVVLFLGRLEEVKGLRFLLEAFASAMLEDTVLVIAGSGSQHEELQRLAAELGLNGKVRFPGHIRQEETVALYAISWVFVLPSISTPRAREPWGLVVNEAFNQGVPIIASETVGAVAGGLVQDAMNGLVVPERDSQALAKALSRILEEPGLRQRLGQHACATIAAWDNEHMIMGFRRAVEYVTHKDPPRQRARGIANSRGDAQSKLDHPSPGDTPEG